MPTAARVRDVLAYNPETGVLRWRVSVSNNIKAGAVAGYVTSTGYRNVCVGWREYRAHRLIWLHVHGEWPRDQIDHINGKRDDNRLCNLREVTNRLNGENRTKSNRNSGTGLLGVSLAKGDTRFRATITIAGKLRHLGYFATAEEAHCAYLSAKRVYHEGSTL